MCENSIWGRYLSNFSRKLVNICGAPAHIQFSCRWLVKVCDSALSLENFPRKFPTLHNAYYMLLHPWQHLFSDGVVGMTAE